MKIYHINSSRSKIKWNSKIGDDKIEGEISPSDGQLISELDEIVEGNISFDLQSLKLTDTSFLHGLNKTLKSYLRMKQDETIGNFKIEEVVPSSENKLIKGILMVNNHAFGVDMLTKFEKFGTEIKATGEINVRNSNPVLLNELDNLYGQNFENRKSIDSFNIECELIANE